MSIRTRVGAAVAACAAVAVVAGCSSSSDGSAEPVPSDISTTTQESGASPSDTPDTSEAPATSSDAPVSDVPAPDGWQQMTCREFSDLTPSQQVAILKANGSPAPPEALETAANLLSVGCGGFPDLPITDALAGNIPD